MQSHFVTCYARYKLGTAMVFISPRFQCDNLTSQVCDVQTAMCSDEQARTFLSVSAIWSKKVCFWK